MLTRRLFLANLVGGINGQLSLFVFFCGTIFPEMYTVVCKIVATDIAAMQSLKIPRELRLLPVPRDLAWLQHLWKLLIPKETTYSVQDQNSFVSRLISLFGNWTHEVPSF